jgi:hypothetical protein
MVIHFQVPDATFQSILREQLLSKAGCVPRTADKERFPKCDARKQALRKESFTTLSSRNLSTFATPEDHNTDLHGVGLILASLHLQIMR